MSHEAIVLAGGLGTRLAGVVAARPKALAEIAGRPFLDWQLDYLTTQPIERVVLAVGHLADAIVERYGGRFGRLALDYAREREPLGTGGAIRNAMSRLTGDGAYVLNGDTIAAVPLRDLRGEPDEDIVVAIREVGDASAFGSVVCERDRIVRFGEKRRAGPGFVNVGVYWIARRLFSRWKLPARFSLETDVLEAHAASLMPRAVVVDVPFIDIGTPDGYARAQTEIPRMLAGLRLRGP
jgi:D-glycero-alpha-D-manno-heptose 1-phosphate guanylyltransferase